MTNSTDFDIDDDDLMAGGTSMTLQRPVRLPISIKIIADMEQEIIALFGDKASNIVLRHHPDESPCIQFELTVPQPRKRIPRKRQRSGTGRPPGRPRKNPPVDIVDSTASAEEQLEAEL